MIAGGGDKKSGSAKIRDPIKNKGRSDEKAGKLFAVSGRFVSDAKKIKQSDPELFQ